jgi:threonine dehydratase
LATPVVRLDVTDAPAEIYLKLEGLQPTGSFKIRTAGNQILQLTPEEYGRGIYTASSGNLGIATAWFARELGIPATVLLPEDARSSKLGILESLGAEVRRIPYADWWNAVRNRGVDGMAAHYIDADGPRAIAGSATLGLEINEQLPDADTVLCSFGSGALACGVATAIKALQPAVRVLACELETATPLTAALEADKPVEVSYASSFVSGMGSTRVLPSMWPMVRDCLDGSAVVSLHQVCDAIRALLDSNHVAAEGAGAAPVAAALAGQAGPGKIVCIVGGGNLGRDDLAAILAGRIPGDDFS